MLSQGLTGREVREGLPRVLLVWSSEAGFTEVAQASLELTVILLTLPPKCRDSRLCLGFMAFPGPEGEGVSQKSPEFHSLLQGRDRRVRKRSSCLASPTPTATPECARAPHFEVVLSVIWKMDMEAL